MLTQVGELAIEHAGELAVYKFRDAMKDYKAETLNEFSDGHIVRDETKKIKADMLQKAEEKSEEPIVNAQANVEPERFLKLMGDF